MPPKTIPFEFCNEGKNIWGLKKLVGAQSGTQEQTPVKAALPSSTAPSAK